MKRLYLVGGAMGVGKTTACQLLKRQLDACVFLDGDWCWDMHPFQVTEETKRMVLDNICFQLNRFLRCSVFENVVFCWVMHRQEILDEIRSRLSCEGWRVLPVSLVCREEELRARLEGDVARGVRTEDAVMRGLAYLPCYAGLDTVKIDTTGRTPREVAEALLDL